MARDPNLIAARMTTLIAGDQSGTASQTLFFKFNGSLAPTLTDWQNLETDLKAFYNSTPSGGAHSIAYYMGLQHSRGTNANEIALYQIDTADPEHYFGSPVHVVPWTLAASIGGNPLPNEVAATLSFRAGYGTDPEHSGSQRPRAQDRGRIYLGPLDQAAISPVTIPTGTQFAQWLPGFVTLVKAAVVDLVAATLGHQWVWSVFSRHDSQFKQVQYYAMDPNTDTQRKRSLSSGLLTWISL